MIRAPSLTTTFQHLLGALPACHRLTSLRLDPTASNVFRGDLAHLQAYFLDGKVFHSPALEDFAAVITDMSELRKLHLDMHHDDPAHGRAPVNEPVVFLKIAFSGLPLERLWRKVKEHFQPNGTPFEGDAVRFDDETDVRVTLPGGMLQSNEEQTLGYGTWLAWYRLSTGFLHGHDPRS